VGSSEDYEGVLTDVVPSELGVYGDGFSVSPADGVNVIEFPVDVEADPVLPFG